MRRCIAIIMNTNMPHNEIIGQDYSTWLREVKNGHSYRAPCLTEVTAFPSCRGDAFPCLAEHCE